ncbi:hypothetical protein [Burkholderia plantarii]|uniref:hypothetical protein n=1 Tax=Burkholderia plantarii TaxID=41899 RepID=UPI000A69FC46|nr:hypothetical protein [Burkholderia plantarii]
MIPGAGPQWPGPVSYTHLDVYKRQAFDRFLATLGYPYHEETANPAYRLFLS